MIRARRQDEMEVCVRLLAEVHAADGYPMYWPTDPAGWLTPENMLAAWVAEDEHGLIGHVALCSADGESAAPLWSEASGLSPEHLGVVAKLFGAPRARGRGVGAALLATVCAEASIRGLHPVLEVLDHDRGAIALYERMGWRLAGSAPALWAQSGSGHASLCYYIAPD